MKIPLAAIGIHFSGDCLGCGNPIADEKDWAVARTYCRDCTVQRNAAITVAGEPAPRTASGIIFVAPEIDTYGREPMPTMLRRAEAA